MTTPAMKILLVVSGGIAAYKAPELVRAMIGHIMKPSAIAPAHAEPPRGKWSLRIAISLLVTGLPAWRPNAQLVICAGPLMACPEPSLLLAANRQDWQQRQRLPRYQ